MKRIIVLIVFCCAFLNMASAACEVTDSIPSPSQVERQKLLQSVDDKTEAVEKLSAAISILDLSAKAVTDTLGARRVVLLALQNELSNLESDIRHQESQLADLSEMSEKFAHSQLTEALSYVQKNYSQMNSDELNEYLTDVEELSDSASLAGIARVKDVRDNLLMYVSVNEELANDCSEEICKSLISRIEAVVQTVGSDEQKDELWDLIYIIEDFSVAKERLASTAVDIAAELEPFRAQGVDGDADASKEAIKIVLARDKSRLSYQNYISLIPFTKGKYDELMQQLDSNPLVESAVEKEILQWK